MSPPPIVPIGNAALPFLRAEPRLLPTDSSPPFSAPSSAPPLSPPPVSPPPTVPPPPQPHQPPVLRPLQRRRSYRVDPARSASPSSASSASPSPSWSTRASSPSIGMAIDAAPMLKRKGAEALEELWLDEDPASGFPVSSRATKIRRLDAEVMPPVVPTAGVPPQPQPVARFGVEEVPMCGDVAPTANEERAIVVYKPAEVARSLLLGPLWPGVPLRVSPEWIHGLKNTMLQEASNHQALFQELARDESSNLAMVPWAPSHSQATSTASATATEMMDAEDSEGTSMEVEQDMCDQPATAGTAQGEALHQWPRHCMGQQPLPAASYQSSPVTWSW